MAKLLHVSSSPHDRSPVTTRSLMRDVIISLLPATLWGIYRFGFRAFMIILISITTAVVTEYAYIKLFKLKPHPFEASAVVTGLLLALNLPVSVPYWIPILGSVFAIVVVKMLYGGLGYNFMNPALGARCFLVISFAGIMTNFNVEKGNVFVNGASGIDGISGATPLTVVKGGELANASLFDMFFGLTAGTIGEVSAFLLILGGLYLIIKKVISPIIPFTYIITLVIFVVIFGGHGFDIDYIAKEIFGGGLMLGAFFMATDYVTSPVTTKGRFIFAVILGLLTGLFRIYGNSAEGVSYAIIFTNILVPLIEKFSMPKAFGTGKRAYKRAAGN